MRRALLGLTTAIGIAWVAFAIARLARSANAGLLPNALAGDVLQAGAAAVILGSVTLAIARALPPGARTLAALLAAAVAASVALGHPWRGVAGAPMLALLVALPLALAGRMAVAASAIAWLAFGALALATDPEPMVALVSHVVPGTLALAPHLFLRASPRSLKPEPGSRAAWAPQ